MTSQPTTPELSIIVPCRNEAGAIGAFINSVLRQDLDGIEWEMIVADGRSDDGTMEKLVSFASQSERIRVIDNPGGIVSTGLNRAIAQSRGSVILRMDVHTIYASDYARQCLAVLRTTGADNVGGPWVARGAGYVSAAISAAFASRVCSGGGLAHNPGYEGEVDTVYLGCWRRSVFGAVGTFDEDLVRNQDDEHNLRLKRAGAKVWQSPRIRSWYTPRNSLRRLFRQYFQYGYWKTAVLRKHGRVASIRHLAPGAFVAGNCIAAVLVACLWLLGNRMAAPAALLWALSLAVYAITILSASVGIAARTKWQLLPVLPVVIATFHVSYGLGFIIGLAKQQDSGRGVRSRRFSALTR